MEPMKFQILKAFKTAEISKDTSHRLILPEQVIEMRWIQGDKWCQFYAKPSTDWKKLCKMARSAKKDFKLHLATGQANG